MTTAKTAGMRFGWIEPNLWMLLEFFCKRLSLHVCFVRLVGGLFMRFGPTRRRVLPSMYCASDTYIIVWLVLGTAALALKNGSQWMILPAIYRVLEILLKEVAVFPFDCPSAKISRRGRISSHARVISLALLNYLTAGLLFNFLYATEGFGRTLGLSVHFLLGVVLPPKNVDAFSTSTCMKMILVGQGFFCFFFVIVVLAHFVSLSSLRPSSLAGRRSL